MALGPFVRIIAQIAVVAGGHIGRAVAEAYKEAAAGRGAAGAAAQRIARRRMSLDEAKKVLDADAADGPAKIQVERVCGSEAGVSRERTNMGHAPGAQTPATHSVQCAHLVVARILWAQTRGIGARTRGTHSERALEARSRGARFCGKWSADWFRRCRPELASNPPSGFSAVKSCRLHASSSNSEP